MLQCTNHQIVQKIRHIVVKDDKTDLSRRCQICARK